MPEEKTLAKRERELLSLIVTRDGRDAPQALAARYEPSCGKARPHYRFLIAYIVAHQRSLGLVEM
jgi:hypothetical protein